ncbi:PAS domain-containing protein [Deinococcus lacus]|uniref:histidine kinase n=1 Tax=Deinococcus lacus TaxID=392561 RepID=A0ABW1YA02_9DEIO
MTTPYRRQDGTFFTGEAHRSLVLGSSGEPVGLLEVVRDVTAHISTQRALQAEERRSRLALDAIPHMLWLSDATGWITYGNLEYRLHLPSGLRAQMHPADLERYDDLWEEAYAAGEGFEVDVRVNLSGYVDDLGLKEPLWRWLTVRAAPILDKQNRVTEWVSSATDNHDRLMAEQRAQLGERRYRELIESMPQIVWLMDPYGNLTYSNARWLHSVAGEGLPSAGRFESAVHPDDRADYTRLWAASLRSGQVFEAEHRLRGPGGRYRHFVSRAVPVRDESGQVTEWVGTTTDVDSQTFAESASALLVEVSDALAPRPDEVALNPQRYRDALGCLTRQLTDSAAVWLVRPADRPPGRRCRVALACTGHSHRSTRKRQFPY